MGQTDSKEAGPQVSSEEISRRLAARFAKKCFTSIELFSFQEVFKELAEHKEGIYYWREETLCNYLEIPDALEVGPLMFQAASFLGAFPFLSAAPVILNFEAMVKVVAIFTGKYASIMKGKHDPIHLLFRAFSEYDRGPPGSSGSDGKPSDSADTTNGTANNDSSAFAIGGLIEDEEDDDDDDMALAALDALDAIEVFKHGEKSDHKFIRRISAENLTKLLMFLLLTAPLDVRESLALHADRCLPENIGELRRTAEDITRGIITEGDSVTFHAFERAVKRSIPFLFEGMKPLFSHMLFSKKVMAPSEVEKVITTPRLLSPASGLMTHNMMCQLSFFLGGENLWQRLRQLYVGSEAGFSMGSFEQKVFNWRAPTVLLVAGHRIASPPETARERQFEDTLARKRYPDSDEQDDDDRLIFGAYIPMPWKRSAKDCFGDPRTKLFQLSPVHEVFETSASHTEYAYFHKDAGIGFGSPIPKTRAGETPLHMNLGPVSLILEEGLEFGVFTHSIDGGGAFHSSNTPHRKKNWQDRFEIEELEVWGIGGDKEAEAQAKHWAWEEREAMNRRNINLGSDVEANRALLEMAGIIGGDSRSGGSV